MKTLLCLTVLLIATASPAHHNTPAFFDMDENVELTGVVTNYQWRNPHLYFSVAIRDENGNEVEWRVEAGPLSIMRRLGWDRDTLQPGDRVAVQGAPSRNADRRSAFMRSIETDDGPLIAFMGDEAYARLTGAEPTPGASATGLAGTWVTVLDPEEIGKLDEIPDERLTPAGRASKDGFVETEMHPGLECIPFTVPIMMLTPDLKSIEFAGDRILIRSDFDGAERVVFLDPEMPEPAEPSLHGFSRGRIDGRTLQVDTGDFPPHRSGIAFGLASSPEKHLVESFELSDDGTSLTYRFRLTDSRQFAGEIEGEQVWVYRPDLEFEPSECDLENSRLFLEQ